MTWIPAQENKSECKKEIVIWFDKMGLPYDIYNKLSLYQKDILLRSICNPFKAVSTEEHRKLYSAFCSTMEFSSRNYKLGDEATDEYVRDFFGPNSEHDKMPKDDWGGDE